MYVFSPLLLSMLFSGFLLIQSLLSSIWSIDYILILAVTFEKM